MLKIKFNNDEKIESLDKVRVDKFLKEYFETEKGMDLSRENIQYAIENDYVTLEKDGQSKKIKSNYILKDGDEIVVDPKFLDDINPVIEVTQDDIDEFKNAIIYEDDDIVVINKPKGMIVQTGIKGTISLCDILEKVYPDIYIDDSQFQKRVGIVHRLDKDTSGLMVIAKNKEAYDNLKQQFKDKVVKKKYYAVIHNKLKQKSSILDFPIMRDENARHKMKCHRKGKESITQYDTIMDNRNYALMNITLHTGRTHQIRVHFSHIKCPLVGDYIYSQDERKNSNEFGIKGQVLESYYLSFLHPKTGERLEFEIPYSEEIQSIIDKEFK